MTITSQFADVRLVTDKHVSPELFQAVREYTDRYKDVYTKDVDAAIDEIMTGDLPMPELLHHELSPQILRHSSGILRIIGFNLTTLHGMAANIHFNEIGLERGAFTLQGFDARQMMRIVKDAKLKDSEQKVLVHTLPIGTTGEHHFYLRQIMDAAGTVTLAREVALISPLVYAQAGVVS